MIDNVDEARSFFTALSVMNPLYLENNGNVYEVKMHDVSITVVVSGEVKELKSIHAENEEVV